jgi:two-component system phosphate regulon sensor histidine kinase PhoR
MLGLVGGGFLTRRLTRRLSKMVDAATAIAEGKSPLVLPADANDETGELVRALRRMDEQLQERHASLVRERNELAGVLASMLEGVVAVGPRQRIVQMNDVARSMLHVEKDDVVGEHIAEVTPVVEVCEILETVIRDNTQETDEIRTLTPNSTRVLQLHASPLREAGGDPGGAVLVLHDVTELRRLEAVRRDFVTNVSHELKTPLAAMQGLIETVIDDESLAVETRTQFLKRSLSQTARLAALVEDLLTLSRVESETSVMERTRLDVRRSLREAAERLEPIAKRSDLAFHLDLPSEPLLVMGDEEGVRQIADNLLDNAQKYTPPGGRIDLRARAEGREAVLDVTDSGIGIAEEHLDRIFERFYRVDKARSRSLGGTGLGLAIVKHLVEAHGGRIEVESTPGKGSSFRIRLPLAGV